MRKVDFLLDGCAVIVKSVIHLARNSTFHQRTKQIDAKHHFICTLLKYGNQSKKIHIRENPAHL